MTIRTHHGRRRLDIVFGKYRVGIEVQSVTYHGDEPAMTRDATKMNAFTSEDEWKILLLTPSMMVGQAWEDFVTDLRMTLKTQADRLGEEQP